MTWLCSELKNAFFRANFEIVNITFVTSTSSTEIVENRRQPQSGQGNHVRQRYPPLKNFPTLVTLTVLGLFAASGRADPILASASSFAVLGASAVTNTGSSVLSGNLGVATGTSITGFPPGTVINGQTYDDTAPAITGQADAAAGYTTLKAAIPTQTLTGQDLGNMVLAPGVYTFASSAQLTGPLTLDFENENNVNIVFQIGSTLTTASDSSVNVINQGNDDNVYYEVGSSATLGTGTTFEGDIIANASITLNTGANITCGSAIALNGAVTLQDNAINDCSATGSDVGGETSAAVTPEPGTFWLLSSGLLGTVGVLRRRLLFA
jgi:type VI secretion system secreted protein VgrG